MSMPLPKGEEKHLKALRDFLHQLTRDLDADVITRKVVKTITDLQCWQGVSISLSGEKGMQVGDNSELVIPIMFEEEMLGALNLKNDPHKNPAKEDVDFARSVADIAAIALKNSQRFNSLRETINEHEQAEKILRHVQQRYYQLFENAPVMYVLTETRNDIPVIQDCNQRFHEQLGYTRMEVIGKPLANYYIPNSSTQLESGELLTLQRNFDVDERKLVTKSGSIIHALLQAIPEFDMDGHVIGIYAAYIDISKHKNLETLLVESEARFRQMAENIQEVFWMFDVETQKHIYVSPSYETTFGITEKMLYETPHLFVEKILPEDRAAVRVTLEKESRGERAEIEYRIHHPDGTIHWIWDRSFPVYDENKKLLRTAGVATDITEIKNAQQELQRLNHTLEERVKRRTAEVQDLYDNAPNGYHSIDINGTFVMINQTELSWLGYTAEEIVGKKTFRELLTPQSRKMFDETFTLFKEQGWIKDVVFEVSRKNGSVFQVLFNASAIRDEYGNFLMSRSTMVDITERRKAEEALRQSRDELSIANAALQKAARIKDEFLASMSHELRTPLTGILGLSEALQLKIYGELSHKQLQTVKNIEESGRHLLELINDILDLSKIEAGKLQLQVTPCSLADVCRASLQLIKGMANHKNQSIYYTPADEPIILHADARRLKQILVNLLSNAVKFTPEEGDLGLEVQVNRAEGNIKLVVWDKGIGIKSEDLHKLFKPFTQIDSSLAREYSGTGLGLSLVHRLTRMHNGSIKVESAFGEGSRFTVTLPWSPAGADFLPIETHHSAERKKSPAALNQQQDTYPLILMVDDNEVTLELVADFLETRKYRVVKIRSGIELLQKAAELHPDLMLVDIQMPGMDGLETINHIRLHEDPRVAAAPVIAVTALVMPGDREQCLQAGANDYMSKPIKLNELAAKIQKMFEKE